MTGQVAPVLGELNPPRKMGAPGLAFETGESTNPECPILRFFLAKGGIARTQPRPCTRSRRGPMKIAPEPGSPATGLRRWGGDEIRGTTNLNTLAVL
jgi:hypothetical protein